VEVAEIDSIQPRLHSRALDIESAINSINSHDDSASVLYVAFWKMTRKKIDSMVPNLAHVTILRHEASVANKSTQVDLGFSSRVKSICNSVTVGISWRRRFHYKSSKSTERPCPGIRVIRL